jgi:hypothetical protein
MINKYAEDVIMLTVVCEKKSFDVVCQICSTLNFPLKINE